MLDARGTAEISRAEVIRHETRIPSEVWADQRQQVESPWDRHRRYDAPRAELRDFRPEPAGLPATSPEDAARHVKEHRDERPWLTAVDKACPEASRIIASADAGDGHAHIRHEGWVTEERLMRRAAYLEDPAQLDPVKRANGIDGLSVNDRRHFCADMATRIADPDAFATAFARGIEHPKVRAAIDRPFDPEARAEISIPIADILGTDGYKYCTGWQLESVAGDQDAARANRKSWALAKAADRQPEVPEPRTSPVPTFEGGTISYVVSPKQSADGYEVKSMYPNPRDEGAR
jgi:hypothetical protein